MNVVDSSGEEVTTPPADLGQTSAITSFADAAPDTMALWPIIAAVGVTLALTLTLLVLASLVLARRGR